MTATIIHVTVSHTDAPAEPLIECEHYLCHEDSYGRPGARNCSNGFSWCCGCCDPDRDRW